MRAPSFFTLIAVFTLANTCHNALAEAPVASTAPTTQAGPVEQLTATCIKAKGRVQWAPVGSGSTEAQVWKPVKVNEEYGAGIQIRTGVRSSAILKFGDDTVVMIGRSTLAAISEYHKTAGKKRTRIGLDYGSVRAGVAETELRSDFQIDSPVATLTKRGTWNFGLWVERGTGRYEATLADRGLVEILNKLTGRRQQIDPKQFVTQAMLSWAETAKFTRGVVIADHFGQTAEELLTYLRSSTGRTGLDPAGVNTGQGAPGGGGGPGAPAGGVAPLTRTQRSSAGSLPGLSLVGVTSSFMGGPDEPGPVVVDTDDGDFGTGTPLVPASVQKRIAKRAFRKLAGNPRLAKKLFRGRLK